MCGFDWAAKYVGLAHAPRGRGPDGFDCWGLVREVYGREFGIELPDYLDGFVRGGDEKRIGQLVREERQGWRTIWPGAEQPGDGILLRVRGEPMHIGIVVEPGTMLHVMAGCNSVLERYRSIMWEKRVEGFYRHGSRTGKR